MKLLKTLAILLALSFNRPALSNETDLIRRLLELEKRVTLLEKQLELRHEKDLWKDPVMWKRVTKEMDANEVRKLLGKPGRIENRIFTTWYYHPTSKLHSFVWFDQGKVLGWKAPE